MAFIIFTFIFNSFKYRDDVMANCHVDLIVQSDSLCNVSIIVFDNQIQMTMMNVTLSATFCVLGTFLER